MHRYGLIGYPISHSFSQRFFTEKFEREGRTDCRYELFPLPDIAGLPALLAQYADLRGLNVTIPHKQAVLPFLHALDDTARAIGAVNTVAVRDGRLYGYNTDAYGFGQSLRTWLAAHGVPFSPTGAPEPGRRLTAWVLGTGGAAKAVQYVLQRWSVPFRVVSREPGPGQVAYGDLPALVSGAPTAGTGRHLWINTTPLGMYPNVETCPPLPFDQFSTEHLVYDLVYNPADTVLLQQAAARGAAVKNGLEMLHRQAERAWAIWQGETGL